MRSSTRSVVCSMAGLLVWRRESPFVYPQAQRQQRACHVAAIMPSPLRISAKLRREEGVVRERASRAITVPGRPREAPAPSRRSGAPTDAWSFVMLTRVAVTPAREAVRLTRKKMNFHLTPADREL